MKGLKAIGDLVLYGNFWIALCATSCAALTFTLVGNQDLFNPITFFLFGGSLFIYGIHRSVGIKQLGPFIDKKRYSVISRFRGHIKIYAVLGLLVAVFFFFKLKTVTWIAMVPFCLLALAYVTPFLKRKRRLRDLPYVKIFLIAICWMGLTALIPLVELGMEIGLKEAWICVDRFLFILLITLPFDIRDLEVDAKRDVGTIPIGLGLRRTKILAGFITLLLVGMICFAFFQSWIPGSTALVFLSVYGLSLILVLVSAPELHDYFYTGLVDGLMILLALPIILLM